MEMKRRDEGNEGRSNKDNDVNIVYSRGGSENNGTIEGMEERKEDGYKGEGPTVARNNADEEREMNRRTTEEDMKSEMCASEKKQEHARKIEKDGKGSCEERPDEDSIRRGGEEEVTKAESMTQILTVEDIAVYMEAFNARSGTKRLTHPVMQGNRIKTLIGGSGRRTTRRAHQPLLIYVRSVEKRMYVWKEQDKDVSRDGYRKNGRE